MSLFLGYTIYGKYARIFVNGVLTHPSIKASDNECCLRLFIFSVPKTPPSLARINGSKQKPDKLRSCINNSPIERKPIFTLLKNRLICIWIFLEIFSLPPGWSIRCLWLW